MVLGYARLVPGRLGLRWRSMLAIAVLTFGVLGIGSGRAMASGVVSTFTVAPASSQAGGETDVAVDLKFDYTGRPAGDTVKDVAVTFAPGLVASVANVPATCSTAQLNANMCPVGSEIGSGSVTVNGTKHNAALYLMPPPTSSDVAGLGAVVSALVSVSGMGAFDLASDASGQPVLEAKITVPTTTPSLRVSEITATFNALSSDGQAFMRMPTSCSTASSSVSVDTLDGATGSDTSSFTPTGCSSLGYAPSLSSVRVIRDAGDSGAEVIASLAQPGAASESATGALELVMPSSVSPTAVADSGCLIETPCQVGTASASSPLVPSSYLSRGTVTLGGSRAAPMLIITFPPPMAFSLSGTINLATGAVTFADWPDLPLSGLTVDITGPSGAKAFTTTCAPGDLFARFTPQSGGPAVGGTEPIAYQNCPTPTPSPTPGPTPAPNVPPNPPAVPGNPTAAGAIGGLANGHPRLRIVVSHGLHAPNIASIAISPSNGLGFRKCRTKRKRHTCNGMSVSGASVKAVRLRAGRLAIVLAKPSRRVAVTVTGPLLSESKSLHARARRHKVKTAAFTVKAVDAKHKTTTIPLTLNV